MAEELPRLVLAQSDRLLQRAIGSDWESETESDMWTQSAPMIGARIVNTWHIYPGMWLLLSKTDAGHYLISRSIDGLRSYAVVHNHANEIYNIFYLADGHAIFCAVDGWWSTRDAGLTWSSLVLGDLSPRTAALAAVATEEGVWDLVAYGQDRKIYRAVYPGGEWAEVYDTSGLWSARWYPAIAGCPLCVLIGVGETLLRTTYPGTQWQAVQQVPGVVKSIVVSAQSNLPVFLIAVEQADGQDKLYWSYDLGDTLVPDLCRIGSVTAVQAVTPTGTGEVQRVFAVLGKRDANGQAACKIIRD